MRTLIHILATPLIFLVVSCSNQHTELISRIPPDALFAIPLNEFIPRIPDYRRVKQDGIFTERMGFSPERGRGFAQFTYILGPPGSFLQSEADTEGAQAALELAVRGDPLFAKIKLTFGVNGIVENRYGDVFWQQFSMRGHSCAVLGQSFDGQSGLHGYYCVVGDEAIDEERIQNSAQLIIRRPLDMVGDILR